MHNYTASNTSRKLFWIVFCIFLCLFFAVKYGGPRLIEYLYHNNSTELLNTLSGTVQIRSLDFYRGRIEDVALGPLASVISGLLLLGFCFTYVRCARGVWLAVAVFVYLLVTRHEVLFYPPYGESLAAPFAGVVWLVRHSFNYVAYLQEGQFSHGGARVYPTSIYPTFLACIMAVTPSAKSFLVTTHALIFGFASIWVAVYREMISRVFNRDTGLLIALLVVSLPLFQSMVELINMEMGCVLFGVLSAYYITRRNIAMGSGMAVISLLMKAPGGILCAAALMASILLCFDDANKKRCCINVAWGLGAVTCALIKAIVRGKLLGAQSESSTIALFAGWEYMQTMALVWFFVGSVVLFFWEIFRWWRTHEKKTGRGSDFISEFYVPIVMFLISGLWFILYLNFSVMGYRYELLLAPFFMFCLVYNFRYFIRSQKMFTRVLIGVIIFSFLCAHGLIYRDTIESSIYSYNTLERSLEYRNDLKLHMRLAQEIEQRYSGYLIAAPFVVAQALALSELGYVERTMDVMVYGIHLNYGNIKNFSGLRDLDITRTLWLGFYASPLPKGLTYPMDEQDRHIKDIEVGDKRIALFMGGFAIEKARIIYELSRRGLLKQFLQKK